MAEQHVINPGGGHVDIPDVDAYLTEARGEGREPYVDLGGDMLVPLAELVDDGPHF